MVSGASAAISSAPEQAVSAVSVVADASATEINVWMIFTDVMVTHRGDECVDYAAA